MSWISPRKSASAADIIAGNLLNNFVLHDIVASVKAPLHELSKAHLVMLEVPPVAAHRFEHDLLAVVQKVRLLGPEVAIIVQPSLRKRTNKTIWVHKWNFLPQAPFKFSQTCSCQMGDGAPGCHFTCYVGNTQHNKFGACQAVPTPTASPDAVQLGLSGTIHTLCAVLLAAVNGVGLVERASIGRSSTTSPAVTTHPLCANHLSSADEGSQQTPGSAQTPTAYPTDAKEREKARKKQDKEDGIERTVKKRKI